MSRKNYKGLDESKAIWKDLKNSETICKDLKDSQDELVMTPKESRRIQKNLDESGGVQGSEVIWKNLKYSRKNLQ